MKSMRQSNMRIPHFIVAAILLISRSVDAQVQPEALRIALVAFGREDYSHAQTLLEAYATSASHDAGMLYYYLGECYFQSGDLPSAEIWLKQSVQGGFNRQEALWRLDQIAEKKGDTNAHDKLASEIRAMREQLTEAQQSIRCLPPANPDGTITIPLSSERKDGLSWAARYWRRGCVQEAINAAQFWEGVDIPLEKRLRTEREVSGYRSLSTYFEKWGEHLEDEGKEQTDVESARRMARHYLLKSIVIQAKGAADKLEKWPKLPRGAVD